MIELVLVRHAQPDWEPDGRAVDEPGLTDLGRLQAARVAEALGGERFDVLYSSTMRRAVETAAPLARALRLEARPRSWLCEMGLPSLLGTPREEVAAFFDRVRARDLEEWWKESIAGAESFRHFSERVRGGIEALLLGDHRARVHGDGAHRLWHPPQGEQRIAIVAHGGSIAVMVAHLLGLAPVPWAHERMALGWAGIVRLRTRPIASGSIWSLQHFNARSHLDALSDPEG